MPTILKLYERGYNPGQIRVLLDAREQSDQSDCKPSLKWIVEFTEEFGSGEVDNPDFIAGQLEELKRRIPEEMYLDTAIRKVVNYKEKYGVACLETVLDKLFPENSNGKSV